MNIDMRVIARSLLPHVASGIIALQSVLFYTFALRARVELGIWPTSNNPDPKSLGFDLHYSLMYPGLLICLWTPVIFGIGILVARRSGATRAENLRALAIYILTVGLGLCLFIPNWGDLGGWFLD